MPVIIQFEMITNNSNYTGNEERSQNKKRQLKKFRLQRLIDSWQ